MVYKLHFPGGDGTAFLWPEGEMDEMDETESVKFAPRFALLLAVLLTAKLGDANLPRRVRGWRSRADIAKLMGAQTDYVVDAQAISSYVVSIHAELAGVFRRPLLLVEREPRLGLRLHPSVDLRITGKNPVDAYSRSGNA